MSANTLLEATSPVETELFNTVEAVLPTAYARLAKDHRHLARLPLSQMIGMRRDVGLEGIHYQGLCEQATRWMVQNLTVPDHEIHADSASAGQRSRDMAQNPMLAAIPSNRLPYIPLPDRPRHTYPVIGDIESGLVVDLVWQQFLPDALKRSNNFPKALIGTRSTIREQVHDYGVSEIALDFWLPPSERIVRHNEQLTSA